MTSYHLKSGGKRIRPLVDFRKFGKIMWLHEIKETEILTWLLALNLIHNATLLHDDVIDNSESSKRH